MQFICDRDSFNRELGLVCRVIPAKPTHPILANILLEADANRQKIALTAFDLSTAIRLELEAEVIDGGKITLPGKLLSDTLSRLDGEEFMLIVDEPNPQTEAQLAFIKGESSQATLESIKAEEYPSLPIINSAEGCSLNLSIATLRKGLQGTLFAASTDETKQVLQGIHLSAAEAGIEFASTDGHRLAVVNLSHHKEGTNGKVGKPKSLDLTVLAQSLRELEKLMAGSEESETITMRYDKSLVAFQLNGSQFLSRRLEGVYPQYRQLLPTQFQREVKVEKKALLSALEFVSVFSSAKQPLVCLSLDESEGTIKLKSESSGVGNAKQTVEADIKGGSLEVAFNVKFLADALRVMPSPEVKLLLNEHNTPAMVVPVAEESQLKCLVMPVMIVSS